jgi:hypothetical protein
MYPRRTRYIPDSGSPHYGTLSYQTLSSLDTDCVPCCMVPIVSAKHSYLSQLRSPDACMSLLQSTFGTTFIGTGGTKLLPSTVKYSNVE